MSKLTITAENANHIRQWLDSRGGIAVWRSQDLSRAGEEVWTPATTPDGRPAQEAGEPRWDLVFERIVSDPADVIVSVDREVKRFHVGTKRGSGLSWVVTDAGTRRIKREVEKAGKGAYYVFDYGDYKNAVIMVPDRQVSLSEYVD